MIHNELKPLLDLVRKNALETKNVNVSFEHLSTIPELAIDVLKKHVSNSDELVEKLLMHEMNKFVEILDSIKMDEMNAIDAMLVVSREISLQFESIFPSVSPHLKIQFPQIYHIQFDQRIKYISSTIRANLNNGIRQNLYRSDLSTELIARLYISRLIDIHNSDYFPAEEFSFEVLFNQMFESLIRSIATPEGLIYFVKQKAFYKL